MPYVSLDNLARFHGRLRDRASSEFASLGMANWQKTAAAGAVSFSPVPEMPLDPVVNFQFTESGPASGTKGPDNPSTITGVTQAKVTRCGKNLVPQPSNGTAVRNGVTFVVADGVFTATGTAGSGNAALYIATATGKDLRVVQGHTYCLSGCPAGGSSSTYYINANIYDDNGNSIAYNILRDYGSGATYTAPSDGWLTVYIGVVSGVEVSGLVFKPQIEDSTSATVFESPVSTVYTIDLGGTYYGGSVDVSAGAMTVTHGYSIVSSIPSTSSMVIKTDSVCFSGRLAYGHPSGWSGYDHVCEELPFNSGADSVNVNLECWRPWGAAGYSTAYFNILKSRLDVSGAVDPSNPTGAEWLAAMNVWLASHPLHCVTSLSTPFTVQLTPLQIYSLSQPDPYNPRVNTVYSDQQSVQAGYPKSPQATQNELTNAVVSLGGNL